MRKNSKKPKWSCEELRQETRKWLTKAAAAVEQLEFSSKERTWEEVENRASGLSQPRRPEGTSAWEAGWHGKGHC